MNHKAEHNETSSTCINTAIIECSVKKISSHLANITIVVDNTPVRALKKEAIEIYKRTIKTAGLESIPDTYVETNYRKEIKSTLEHFILHHFVIDYLTNEILDKKIAATNNPRLVGIEVTETHQIRYSFDVSVAELIDIREWKNFSFKAPKRKNYKDLDKQVALFLKEQCEKYDVSKHEEVEAHDWVCFEAYVINPSRQEALFNAHSNIFWIKVHEKTIEQPVVENFMQKKINDFFITNELFLSKNLKRSLQQQLFFHITIKTLVKGAYFSLESFKTMFKLKNKLEVHEKLIEVFSYRNDLSQRKAIIEEMFHLFFSKHRFEVPKHLILRKQEEILNYIRKRPDYQVYKLHKNFLDQVGLLAEKQLKEEILIDQIAGNENIRVDYRDIQNYLNLFTNERIKEFVYFKPFGSTLEESTEPIHNTILKLICRREKTLNYVLHILTR